MSVGGVIKFYPHIVAHNIACKMLNPHQANVSESLIRRGGKSAPQRKLAISAIFLHSKHQKPYQGTLRTQEPTPIGSETSLGPSMDPTGPLK